MVNLYGLGPTKMTLTTEREQFAICSHSGYGPTFGGGHDLHISNNANKNASSYSELGHTYERPSGQQHTFFTGSRNFIVTDYEVFGLQFTHDDN